MPIAINYLLTSISLVNCGIRKTTTEVRDLFAVHSGKIKIKKGLLLAT